VSWKNVNLALKVEKYIEIRGVFSPDRNILREGPEKRSRDQKICSSQQAEIGR